MPSGVSSFTDEIQQEAIKTSKLIIKSCENFEFLPPAGKVSFTTNTESFLHLQIKQKAAQQLGLISLNKTQLSKKANQLKAQVVETLRSLVIGKNLFEEKFVHPSDYIPSSYFLLCLEVQDHDQQLPSEFHLTYFVLSLYLIAKYENSRLESFDSEDQISDPAIELEFFKAGSRSRELLMLSQAALELGIASEQAFRLHLDRKNEGGDLNTLLQLACEAIKARDNLSEAARKKTQYAQLKWKPMLEEVERLIEDGKTTTNACEIVAKKHEGISGQQLRQARYRDLKAK